MKLTVYTKPTCGYCVLVKRLLTKHDIEYEEIDISTDEQAKAFIQEQGHKTVPQLYRDGDLFVHGGYDGMVEYFAEREKITNSLGDI